MKINENHWIQSNHQLVGDTALSPEIGIANIVYTKCQLIDCSALLWGNMRL